MAGSSRLFLALMSFFSLFSLLRARGHLLLLASAFLGCAGEHAGESWDKDDSGGTLAPNAGASSSTGGTAGNEAIVLGNPDIKGGGAGGAPDDSSCLSVMIWGNSGKYGTVPGERGMDAIAAWLNDASTAEATHFVAKPVINAELLATVDLLLLQDLSDWEFSADEVDLVGAWVREGGGLFALSGFRDNGSEVPPTNQLVSFSAMSYVGQSSVGDTSLVLGDCAYCLGTTHKQEGWNEKHPIAFGLTAVGAYQGRSVQGGGEVVAQEEGRILGMTEEVDEGRVFLFHDDWVSFRSQWEADAPVACQENPECSAVSPRNSYQVAQFWYNAIRWLVPHSACFELSDEAIVKR